MNDTDTYRVTWAAGTEGGTYTTRNRIEADTLLATLAAGNVAARWVQTRAVYTTEHGPPAGDVVMAVQDNGVSWLEQPAPQRNDDSGVTHVAIGEDGLEEAAGPAPAPAAQRYEGPAAPSRLKCTIGDTSAPPKASVIVDEAHGVDLATCERMFGWALTGKQRDAFESALADDKVVTAAANTIGKDWTSVGVDPAAPGVDSHPLYPWAPPSPLATPEATWAAYEKDLITLNAMRTSRGLPAVEGGDVVASVWREKYAPPATTPTILRKADGTMDLEAMLNQPPTPPTAWCVLAVRPDRRMVDDESFGSYTLAPEWTPVDEYRRLVSNYTPTDPDEAAWLRNKVRPVHIPDPPTPSPEIKDWPAEYAKDHPLVGMTPTSLPASYSIETRHGKVTAATYVECLALYTNVCAQGEERQRLIKLIQEMQ